MLQQKIDQLGQRQIRGDRMNAAIHQRARIGQLQFRFHYCFLQREFAVVRLAEKTDCKRRANRIER